MAVKPKGWLVYILYSTGKRDKIVVNDKKCNQMAEKLHG